MTEHLKCHFNYINKEILVILFEVAQSTQNYCSSFCSLNFGYSINSDSLGPQCYIYISKGKTCKLFTFAKTNIK